MAFRVRDVFQTRPPAGGQAEPVAAEPETEPTPDAEAEPEGAPDDGTGAPPARKKPAGPGQAQKIKNDVGNDAKRYAGKLVPLSDPAGALAGVLAYALIINGIRYGTAGITGWLRAKFLNQPMQGQAATALAPPTSKGPVSV